MFAVRPYVCRMSPQKVSAVGIPSLSYLTEVRGHCPQSMSPWASTLSNEIHGFIQARVRVRRLP